MSHEHIAVVTGGSSGLGAAIVEHLAGRGYGVVMNYRQETKARALLDALDKAGVAENVIAFRADVSRRDEVRAMYKKCLEAFGKIDVLVNSAGVNRDAPFLELTDETWDEVVDSHLKGTFICCQEYLRHNPDNPGHILNLGASCGFQGRKNGANFCSAKGGVLALTKCLARELAPRIQVNCLIPGQVDTQEVRERYDLDEPNNLERVLAGIPAERLGELADVTQMIDAILNSRYSTGANFFVNGGDFMH